MVFPEHTVSLSSSESSSEGMASVKGSEGYVGISVARLAVGSEQHSNSSAYPSPHPLQGHVQVEEIDLFMALNRHHLGICSILLRSVPAPVQAD